MKKGQIITISIVVIVAAILIYPMIRKKSKVKPEYITAKIERGTIVNEVTATGTINPVQTVDVGTQVSGIVSKLFADYNDKVKKGQLIAQIDTITLHSSVVDAEATLYKAKSQYEQKKMEFQRYKTLLEKKSAAQSDYDLAYATYQAAESDVKSADAMLKKAKTNLSYATIYAPIDGVIISRDVNLGQTVAASFTTPKLFSIANDLTKMQLEAHVDEADIGQVKVGQRVNFTVDAYPDDIFKGSVKQIRLQPNTVQNVVTYTVIIDAPNPDLKLMPGMNSNISIIVDEHKDVLTVPLAAFNFNPLKDTAVKVNSSDTIWMMNGNQPKSLIVTKATDDGNLAEISGNGVKEGIPIIIGCKFKTGKQMKTFLPEPPKRQVRH